jgi:hypothetical protein
VHVRNVGNAQNHDTQQQKLYYHIRNIFAVNKRHAELHEPQAKYSSVGHDF